MSDNVISRETLISICICIYIQWAGIERKGGGNWPLIIYPLFNPNPEGWEIGRFGGESVFKNSRSRIPKRPLQLQSTKAYTILGWRGWRWCIFKHLSDKNKRNILHVQSICFIAGEFEKVWFTLKCKERTLISFFWMLATSLIRATRKPWGFRKADSW